MVPSAWRRADMTGPRTGNRIVGTAVNGPGPFCGMRLADQGAELMQGGPIRPRTGFMAKGVSSIVDSAGNR